MNKADIKEIANLAVTQSILGFNMEVGTIISRVEDSLQKWFENNHPPKVVAIGLTDEQIDSLADSTHSTSDSNRKWYVDHIRSWQRSQKFEMSSGLTDEQVEEFARFYDPTSMGSLITGYREWSERRNFSHPEVREIPAGLSGKQIVELHQALCLSPPERMPIAVIKEYLKTQNFTQTPELLYPELCQELCKERNELQSIPSWDTAPKWANYLAMDKSGCWNWYESEPELGFDGVWSNHNTHDEFCEVVIANVEQTLQKRPERPRVRVGQKYQQISHPEVPELYEVITVGCMTISNEETNGVHCRWSDEFDYFYSESEFLQQYTLIEDI